MSDQTRQAVILLTDQAESVVPGDQSILHEIETASESIALYTAIIGKRVEFVEPGEYDGSEDGLPPILTISPHWPQVNRMMISVWFRRMAHTARKRSDQAIM